MEVKQILIPVDFSKCSKNALKVAIGIAKKIGAKIQMVNAVHIHTPHPDFSGGVLIDGIISDYEEQVKQSFEELESEIIEFCETRKSFLERNNSPVSESKTKINPSDHPPPQTNNSFVPSTKCAFPTFNRS